MTALALALAAFVGTHLLMSHPLRRAMVAQLGSNGFMIVYSLVSFATLGWVVWAFREAPVGAYAWPPGEGVQALATVIMFAASVLLVGSLAGNPALPDPRAESLAAGPARGVFAITRHPMMWSFALWALAHVLVSPRPPVMLLTGAIALLALVGAAGQDAKKAVLMGPAWQDWVARTAFVPFAKGGAWPGRTALVGGTVLWLLASWAHPWAGAPVAGIWWWL
ncbi:MAG: NnrU family protein [Sphingomonadaceae bacterium]